MSNLPISTSTDSGSPARTEAELIQTALDQGIAKTPVLVEGTSARSIQELMSADPLSLTDDDVERVVTELRQARNKWVQEEKTAADKGKKPRAQSPGISGGQLSLADLGLAGTPADKPAGGGISLESLGLKP